MLRPRRSILACGAALGTAAMAGCASPRVEDYRDARPELDLRRYLDGPLSAHGMFSDRRGQVQHALVFYTAISVA